MSDSSTVVCPECKSVEPASAPFCQNCGYRLRAPDTVREIALPFDQNSLADLLEEHKEREESRKNPKGAVVSAGRPARQMRALNEEKPREFPAEVPGRSGEENTSTLVEGVRAVAPKTIAMPALEREFPPATEGDSRPEREEEAKGSEKEGEVKALRKSSVFGYQRAFVVWLAIFGCLLSMVTLTWLHLQRPSAIALAEEVQTLFEPKVIKIPEGPFRRGLSDDAQSFIMQLCHRMVDESGDQCGRDRLLAGEFPQQTVRMPAFQIDAGPVRNGEYQACVAAGSCGAIDVDSCQVWTPRGLQIGVRMPRALLRDERPLVCATRQEARAYCQWKGGDLPTHNQWEKAARGEEALLYPWGDFWEVDRANWGEEDVMRTSVPGKLDGWAWTNPPGAFPEGKSPYGLYDMAGNVSEWIRGDDELEGHVRGGSWISNPFELRTTARPTRSVEARRTDIGFRCTYAAP